MFFMSKLIESDFSPLQVIATIKDGKQFEGVIEESEFRIRESRFFSNKVLLPVVNGTVNSYGGGTQISVKFSVALCDKIAIGIFFACALAIAVILGIVMADIMFTGVVVCFLAVVYILGLCLYIKNCRRAYRKLSMIL